MPIELISGLIATYGLPTAFGIWILWGMQGGKAKSDPSKEILDTLQDLRDRMTRVETILEERK